MPEKSDHPNARKWSPMDPVMRPIWVQEGSKPERSMAIRHSKALTAYYRLFGSLQIDPKSNLLVYSESNPNVPACIDSFDSKICLPLKLVFIVFDLAHNHPLAGHMGVEKTLMTIKQYLYWPGMH